MCRRSINKTFGIDYEVFQLPKNCVSLNHQKIYYILFTLNFKTESWNHWKKFILLKDTSFFAVIELMLNFILYKDST